MGGAVGVGWEESYVGKVTGLKVEKAEVKDLGSRENGGCKRRGCHFWYDGRVMEISRVG